MRSISALLLLLAPMLVASLSRYEDDVEVVRIRQRREKTYSDDYIDGKGKMGMMKKKEKKSSKGEVTENVVGTDATRSEGVSGTQSSSSVGTLRSSSTHHAPSMVSQLPEGDPPPRFGSQRSDSFLSDDEEDEEDQQPPAIPRRQQHRSRQPSLRYMEDSSLETTLVDDQWTQIHESGSSESELVSSSPDLSRHRTAFSTQTESDDLNAFQPARHRRKRTESLRSVIEDQVEEDRSVLPTIQEEPQRLHTLMRGVCTPEIELEACRALLQLETDRSYATSDPILLPDATVAMLAANHPLVHLWDHELSHLSLPFARALLRLLTRLLTHESDADYNRHCGYILPPARIRLHAHDDYEYSYSALRLQAYWKPKSWKIPQLRGPLAHWTSVVAGQWTPAALRQYLQTPPWRPLPQSHGHLFLFGGHGLRRSITGLQSWPFRNDFGMALWFRAERLDQDVTLFQAVTDDGAGIEIRLPVLTPGACSLAVHVRHLGGASQSVVVQNCVLMPRVWYHVAIRHTRSRLKGVFSLATRQQVSVLLDGKTMLTESLPFPEVDEKESSSLVLRRSSSRAIYNLDLTFGGGLDGQTKALYVFNDSVSDAALRALYEATGGTTGSLRRQRSSTQDSWDARRSDIVRKTKILDANMNDDDAEGIVVSQRRDSLPASRRRMASVIDFVGFEEDDDDETFGDLAGFKSKVFLVWDPRRVVDSLALELHVGAHLSLTNVVPWSSGGVQDVISSIGGVQALIPLGQTLLSGFVAESSDGPSSVLSDVDLAGLAVSDYILLLASVIRSNNDNAREMLRCGGVDVLEQIIAYGKRPLAAPRREGRSIMDVISSSVALSCALVDSLLRLREACSHYVGLEAKVFSRLVFNVPLWLMSLESLGPAFHFAFLPVMSSLTKSNPEKVRDCVGVRDLVVLLKEYAGPFVEAEDGKANRFLGPSTVSEKAKLTSVEKYYAWKCVLAMIFDIMACGTNAVGLSIVLDFISVKVTADWDDESEKKGGDLIPQDERLGQARHVATVLLLLMQVRPRVPGLFESFSLCCGSVHGGAAWILSVLVNSLDDSIRAIGLRMVAEYLDVTGNGDDVQLSMDTTSSTILVDATPGESQRVNSSRVARLAQGLAAIGPGVRSAVLTPSRLTARVVLKLVWNLLRSHRRDLGELTRHALLCWISDVETSGPSDNFHSCAIFSSVSYRSQVEMISFSYEKAMKLMSDSVNTTGRTLKNSLALGTVLRLLRYLDNEQQDRWMSDLVRLAKSSHRSMSVLASMPEWQPSLFHLLSETLEKMFNYQDVGSAPSTAMEGQSSSRALDTVVNTWKSETSGSSHVASLDRCLDLYGSLLGHLFREGGDSSLEAIECTVALQRVCVNGHDVLILILSSLCSDLFENGTVLDIGSIPAEDWKNFDLEHDSIPLRQSAKLVTDAILSDGTKGLDMTQAVRSWRSLRHITEIIAAIASKSGLGINDLFDYANQRAAAVDDLSGGLMGIRLADTRLSRISATDYINLMGSGGVHRSTDDGVDGVSKEANRRLCAILASQVLTLLDSFIFPESLDASLPESQLHGLTLVRNSEPRLGESQGPLLFSIIRLSLFLIATLEPCSVVFLQSASRLRCLLYWALELGRLLTDKDSARTGASFDRDGIDRLLLAIVLYCHRALGRCASLLSEIESTQYDKYFDTKENQKRVSRRVFRVSLELRDIVAATFKGRSDFLRGTLSTEAYVDLKMSLEGDPGLSRPSSKEGVVRDFLASPWVSKYQDIETRADLPIPEQVAMESVPLGSHRLNDPSVRGFVAIEQIAADSQSIINDFEKSLNASFEQYLDGQRRWAETDAVRELELEGDATARRLAERYQIDLATFVRSLSSRRQVAESRWKAITLKTVEPWESGTLHWKMEEQSRVLLVRNRLFFSHSDAAYELVRANEADRDDRKILKEKEDLSELMRRNAEAFAGPPVLDGDASSTEDSDVPPSDGESSADVDGNSDSESSDALVDSHELRKDSRDDSEHDEGWDKIDSDEIENVNVDGDADGWVRTFIWSEGEAVVARFESVVVVALQMTCEGKVVLTTHGLYFHQDGPAMNVITREQIDEMENATPDPRDRRWRLSRLQEIHGRRYMLRHEALELFFSDGHALFLHFPGGSKDRDRFHAKVRNSCKVPLLWSPKSLNPRTVFRRSKVVELWRKRKISNFDYIMALNRMAGRSFNDITQYPVFPWILADYTSATIDLSDSRVYRDLGKPIGALNPDRLAQLLERYRDLDLFGFTEAEKFLYGSHYTSPGIVLHYLIRQEPFTSMAIDLQSGRFDCPDRLFFDIEGSWNGCLTSTSDMKELVPEFFCLPEMFLNTNAFPLGTTQSGREVGNVGLPPWAKGSAHEFVRINRMALESDHVSQNLHLWIDLIFGFKQRGPEAEAAHNIFHHLSYEGAVDLDKIVDEVDRKAAESHIQNFGQTPSQLSPVDPHPIRYSSEEWKPLLYNDDIPAHLRTHTPSKQFGNKSSELAKGAVLKLHALSDSIVAVYGDMSVGHYRWYPGSKSDRLRMDKLRPAGRRNLSSSRASLKRGSVVPLDEIQSSPYAVSCGSFVFTLGGRAKEELRRKAAQSSSRLLAASEINLATAESAAMLVSCGYWDDTIKVHSIDTLKVIASETGGHRGPIRCLALGCDGALLVSGGQDCTSRIWVVDYPDLASALSDGYVQTAIGSSNDGEQILTCCHVLWGQDTPITCVDISTELDVTVSGSEGGQICIHTVRRGDFIRSLQPRPLSKRKTSISVSRICLHKCGNLVVSMSDSGLHTYSVNGTCLSSTGIDQDIADMHITSNGEYLISGGSKCQVWIRRVSDLEHVFAMLDLSKHGPIHSIAMTPDELNPLKQHLFIGSDDGMITIVDEDFKTR